MKPRREKISREARAEIEFHLEMRVRELVAEGMSEEEARTRALAAFGDPQRVASEVARVDESARRRRDLREVIPTLAHDIRYATRFVGRNPAFTAVFVGTLALGIGATTTIFSLVDAALFRRPPVTDPESLVAVYTSCRAGAPRCVSSYPDYLDYRERTGNLADLAAATLQTASLGDDERGARLVTLEAVTGNYFPLLGLSAARGRSIQPDDDALRGGAPVVVLSHALWTDHLGLLRYSPPELLAFASDLQARTLADPRVTSAAVATLVPFQQGGFMGFVTEVEGYQPAPDEEMRMDIVAVSPQYLETLGIPLLAGREIDEGDVDDGPPVAVINRSMAEKYWPGGNAVGGRLRIREELVEVVGVAEDVRWSALRGEPTNFVFVPHAQFTEIVVGPVTLAARTTGDVGGVLATIRENGQRMEPDLSTPTSATMDDLVGDLLMPQRLGSMLLSAFGSLSLLLAAIGIAGVVSYGVREQRRSIGVRLTLGARGGEVVRMVVRGMLVPVAAGLAIGLGAARVLDGGLERFLYGVAPGDPFTYLAIVVAMPAVALLAMLLPAREATRVDPLEVLRSD